MLAGVGCANNHQPNFPLSMSKNKNKIELDAVVGSVHGTTMVPGKDSVVHYSVRIKIPTKPDNPSRGSRNNQIESNRDTLEAEIVFTGEDFPNGFPYKPGEEISLRLNRGFVEGDMPGEYYNNPDRIRLRRRVYGEIRGR